MVSFPKRKSVRLDRMASPQLVCGSGFRDWELISSAVPEVGDARGPGISEVFSDGPGIKGKLDLVGVGNLVFCSAVTSSPTKSVLFIR